MTMQLKLTFTCLPIKIYVIHKINDYWSSIEIVLQLVFQTFLF